MPKTTIILADHHPLTRAASRRLLENETGFAILGETGSGAEVPDMVSWLQPDILVLDSLMDDLHAIDMPARLRKRSPETRVVVFSLDQRLRDAAWMLLYDARAYVFKGAHTGELVQAVHQVMEGHKYISPQLCAWVREDFLGRMAPDRGLEQIVVEIETAFLRKINVVLTVSES